MTAMDVLSILHVPPPTSLSVVDEPTQTFAAPLIAEGSGLTVTVVVIVQPVVAVKLTTGLPATRPYTIPVDGSTVARVVLPQLHVPLPAASLNIVAVPIHTLLTPEIAGGNDITVTGTVATQPAANE
jgi:hypothetical protein